MNLLEGAFAREGEQTMLFQVGANMDQNERVYIESMTAEAFGLQNAQGEEGLITLETVEGANAAIATLDSALQIVSKQRADLGAYQNRFETAAEGVAIAAENLQASESRIRDVDMASQMVDYTKDQILSQAGSALLAQANVQTQSVLQILG
jgi:flagellin